MTRWTNIDRIVWSSGRRFWRQCFLLKTWLEFIAVVPFWLLKIKDTGLYTALMSGLPSPSHGWLACRGRRQRRQGLLWWWKRWWWNTTNRMLLNQCFPIADLLGFNTISWPRRTKDAPTLPKQARRHTILKASPMSRRPRINSDQPQSGWITLFRWRLASLSSYPSSL